MSKGEPRDGAAAHRNRQASESRGYDDLRKAGVNPDRARQAARDASEMAHRRLDQKHSDKGRK